MAKPNIATKPQTTIETDDELLRRIINAEQTIAVAKKNSDQAKAELLARRKSEIEKLLKGKDEPYGLVNLVVGNHKVAVTTPKKVEWAQDKLDALFKQILLDGSNPCEYIDQEFSVSETKWKAWPSELKKEFLPARTVTPGNPSMKIVEEKE